MFRRASSDKSRQQTFDRRKKAMMAWFVAAVMILSTFGFILSYQSNPTTTLDYNGFPIETTKTAYIIHLDKDRVLEVSEHPMALEQINVSKQVWTLLENSKVIGVTFNQSSDLAELYGGTQYFLEKNLAIAPKLFVQRGLLNASDTALQTMSCKEAAPSFPIIYLTSGDQAGARLEGSCIIVEGIVGSDIPRVADRLVLGLAGVMPK